MASAEVIVSGKKYTQEEIQKALETMEKIRATREKGKERVKNMTPEQKAVLKKKMILKRADNALLLQKAAKAGITNTPEEIVAYAKAKNLID